MQLGEISTPNWNFDRKSWRYKRNLRLELLLSLVIRCAKASSPTIYSYFAQVWHSTQNNISTNWKLYAYDSIKYMKHNISDI